MPDSILANYEPRNASMSLQFDTWIAKHRRISDSLERVYDKWTTNRFSAIVYCVVISCVSIYDIYLTIKYAIYLKDMEVNPVGRWLMGLDNIEFGVMPDITLFLYAKTLGTIAVVLGLAYLIAWRGRLGHPVGIGVSLFQLSLAYYLSFVTAST